jgi:excisionase family DNA binding protein
MTIATATIMTLEEAAAYLRVPTDLLQAQAAIGQVPGRKIGSEWRFLRSAIEAWLATPPVGVTAQMIQTTQARNPQLIELLEDWANDGDVTEQTETWDLLKTVLQNHAN